MFIRVLGAGAGGGFPQWNCNCPNCKGLRDNSFSGKPRTQSSIAVSADQENWLLINASPDVRTQLEFFDEAHPENAVRGTGIKAILLIDGQIDHCTGLLILREGEALELYTTEVVKHDLSSHFPIINILSHYCGVNHHIVPIDGNAFFIDQISDIKITAHALASRAPPYSPNRHNATAGDNIGVTIEQISTRKKVYYAPGVAEIESHVLLAMQQADCVLVDGTFWTNDELVKCCGSDKYARDIGHLPQSGKSGMIEVLSSLPKDTDRHLIHINNTNPILNEDSAEYAELVGAGIGVCYDGQTIIL